MSSESATGKMQELLTEMVAKIDRLEGVVAYAMGALAALHHRRPDAERLLTEYADHGHYAAVEIFDHSHDGSDSARDGYVTARLWAQDPKRLDRKDGGVPA